jgi:hypothetical protein
MANPAVKIFTTIEDRNTSLTTRTQEPRSIATKITWRPIEFNRHFHRMGYPVTFLKRIIQEKLMDFKTIMAAANFLYNSPLQLQ